jgi:GMP synthase (glutamine-hydrolysing)
MARDRIVVLRTGDAVPSGAARRGDFFEWIQAPVRAVYEGELTLVDVRELDPLPVDDLLDARGYFVTGSPSSVTERAPWMLRTEALLRRIHAERKPVLGICFGHQIIAQALGGEVAKNPRGREMGTVAVTLRPAVNDPLFDGLARVFPVNATHVDTVSVLPEGVEVLADSALEPTAAYRVGNIRCVQFHPEIDGDVMRGYLESRKPILQTEGFDVDKMLAEAVDTPSGPRILQNFVRAYVLGETS